MFRFPARHVSAVTALLLLAACGRSGPDAPTAPETAEAAELELPVQRFETDLVYGHIRDANIFVVHGINGRDLELDEALPVDIEVNGSCAVAGLRFRQIRGPLTLPGGTYDIRVRLAAAQPCTGTAVISVDDAAVDPGSNLSIVAHLNAQGGPTASIFENDLAGGRGDATIAARHVAAFGAVDVGLRTARPFEGVTNGTERVAAVDPGLARVRIFPAGSPTAAASARAILLPNFLNVVYAVGTPSKGTFELLHQAIFLVGRTSARVALIHGINGRDLSLPESLPVDVELNGVCAKAGLTFRDITRSRPIAEGTYDIRVRLASRTPCAGTAVITAPGVRFERGQYFSVAAHLSAQGSPTASVFRDDIVSRTQATVAARHTANFGPVDVLLNGQPAFRGVTNGQGGSAAAPAGRQTLAIAPAGSRTPALEVQRTLVGSPIVNAFYAVGTPANGTFELLQQRVVILF